MTVKQQWTVVGAIVVVIGGAIWAGAHFLGDQLRPVTVGSRAPDFRATTLDSVPLTRTLADFRGKVTLVNVWATWCAPCEREMPLLQHLYEEFKDKGVRFVAVSADAPGMRSEVRDYATRHGLTFDVLYAPDAQIKNDYMVTAFPESFIIGKDGVIRFKQWTIEPPDTVQIRALLDQLVSERGS